MCSSNVVWQNFCNMNCFNGRMCAYSVHSYVVNCCALSTTYNYNHLKHCMVWMLHVLDNHVAAPVLFKLELA